MSDTNSPAASQSALAGAAKPTSQFSADLNAGFAFFLDVVVNLFVFAGILIGTFDFPREVLFGRMIPGSLVGIIVGNVLYITYTKRLARKTGNENLTSVPLGMDLPSIFSIAFLIVGPVYSMNLAGMGAEAAAEKAWVVGMAATMWMALLKFLMSFVSRAIRTHMPQSSLIGAMAGIATVWLGAEALFGVFQLPEIGIVSLAIMAFTLIAGRRLPFGMPGSIFAIVAGTVLYYILAGAGVGNGYELREVPELVGAVPTPTVGGFAGFFGEVTAYLGIIIPLSLLIVASNINIVAGARLIGDEYDAANVVRVDAAATFMTALFGGVVQTTAYFGHTTYKRMGARTNYAAGVVTFLLVGGFLGVIGFASELIPEPVLKPILLVVASDILRLAFSSTDVRHAPAILFSLAPAILNYAFTKVSGLYDSMGEAAVRLALDARFESWLSGHVLLGTLSRGYILTSLVWGAMIVWIIDGKLKRAAGAALAAAIFSSFGIIHSVLPSAGMYLPWAVPDLGGAEEWSGRMVTGYVIVAVMLLAFNFVRDPETSSEAEAKAG